MQITIMIHYYKAERVYMQNLTVWGEKNYVKNFHLLLLIIIIFLFENMIVTIFHIQLTINFIAQVFLIKKAKRNFFLP